ncbi:LysM peptidoglycan-binding domain-containing protein [Xanthomonas melonis]|uniref:LysM peptidoglycan-binding domain-containing protein n=1 Tax=Xanthomonas melonis TaxID=56456 RepID=UPI003EB8A0F4
MVAVFTGNGLGLFDSSLAALGATTGGTASLGQGRDRQYVNVAQGNLVLQAADEHLNFRGLSVGLNRTYNSLGQLSDVGADGWLTGFERKVGLVGTLNAAGSQVRLQQGDGSTTEFQYDAATRRYMSTAGAGAHDTLSWDAESKTWTLTEGSTRRQEIFADHADASSQGRLLRIIAGTTDGGTSAAFDVVYDVDGRIGAVVQADGTSGNDALVFSYDAQGRLASVGTRQTGVIQHQIAYEYDAQGRLTAVVTDLTPQDNSDNVWNTDDRAANDGHLFRTEYSYVDATSLRIASVRQSDGVVTRYSYQSDGRLASVAYGEGAQAQVYTLAYASDQRQTDITDAAGRTWSYRFDASGQLLEVLSPPVSGQRDVTSYTYDAAGNLLSTRQARGSAVLTQVTYLYDASGNLLRETNKAGEVTIRAYSAQNQLLSETRYLAGTSNFSTAEPPVAGALRTRYVYDSQDRLRFVVDAEGRVSALEYASSGTGIGQLASRRSFAATSYHGTAYTEAALQAWSAPLLADTSLIEYSYDPNGRLALTVAYAQVDANGAGVRDQATLTTLSTYDGQGLLLRKATVRGTREAPVLSEIVDYSYDGMGRLLGTVQSPGTGVGSSAPAEPVDPTDPADPTAPVDPPVDPVIPPPTRTTTYQYLDSVGRIAIAQTAGATQIQVRDSAGRTTTTTLEDPSSISAARTQRYIYDTAGLLRSSEDALGGRVYQFYDEKGRLAAQVDATGTVTGYSYDGADRVVATTTYANRVTTSSWLVDGQVVPTQVSQIGLQLDSANDRVTRRSYDDAGRVLTETSAVGTVTRYAYDGAGRLVSTTIGTGATARVTRNFYDASGLPTATLDAEGFLVERGYDKAGRLIRTTAYATATTSTLRAAGTLQQLRPAAADADQTTRLFYDRRGNLVGQLDPEGYVTEYVFDEDGNSRATLSYYKQVAASAREGNWVSIRQQVAAVADEAAYRQQRRQFNGLGQLETEISTSGLVTRYAYDAAGRLAHTVSEDRYRDQWSWEAVNTRESSRFYNVFGELVAELDGVGSEKLLQAQSDQERQELIARYATHHEYDALGRMIRSTNPNGVATWFIHDAEGRLRYSAQGMSSAEGVKNAQAEITEWRYNAFGDQTEQIRYVGRLQLAVPNSRQSLQDALGTLSFTAATDARQQFTYNANGQVITATDTLGVRTLQAYNVFGQLERVERAAGTPRGTVTTYTYDRRGLQLQTVQDAGARRLNLTQSVRYDAFGRVLSQTDARGSTSNLAYDRNGRLIQTSRVVDGRSDVTTTRYDAFARAVEMTDATGTTTRLVYDDVALTIQSTSPLGVMTRSRYDQSGQLRRVEGAKPARYRYDANGRLVAWREGEATSGRVFDDAGRLISSNENGRILHYIYDDAGRTVASIQPNFGIDPETGLYELLEGGPTTHYTYDGMGRQVRVVDAAGNATEFRYDLAGQLLESVIDPVGLAIKTTYAWDELGRQISIVEAAGTTSSRTTVYTYDAAGRRIREVVDPTRLALATTYTYDANGNLTARKDASGSLTRFTYDAANRLQFQVDGVGGVIQNHYDIAGRLVATRAYAAPVSVDSSILQLTSAQLQSIVVRNDGTDQQQYMLLDQDGRVASTIDGAGGAVAYRYDAKGRLVKTTRFAAPALLNTDNRILLESGLLSLSDLTFEETHALNRTQWNVYYTSGGLAATVDGAGVVVEFFYDEAGLVAGRREYSNRVDLDRYDDSGEPATVRERLDNGSFEPDDFSENEGYLKSKLGLFAWDYDQNYRETAYQRDSSGRVILQIQTATSHVNGYNRDGFSIKEYGYTAAGNLSFEIIYGITINPQFPGDGDWWILGKSVVDFKKEMQTALDSAAIESGVYRESLVRRRDYYYDAAGRQRFAIDAAGAVTEQKFDAMGRTVEKRSYAKTVAGHLETLAEVEANVAGETNYQGDSFRYDAAGRLISQSDRLGRVEWFEYDGAGRTLLHKDRNGAIWNYVYNAAGKKIAQLSPFVTVSSADVAGVVSDTQRRIVTRYTYDGQGNATSMIEDADGGRPRTTRYEYDNRGHQIRTIFPDAGYLDAAGQLVASGKNTTVEITYDAFGNAVMQKDVSGRYSYKSYDAQGRLSYDIDPEGYVISYGYNVFGEQSRLTRHAHKADVSTDMPDPFPESIGRAVEWMNSSDDRTIYTFYDRAGRKTDVATIEQPMWLTSAGDASIQSLNGNEWPSYSDLSWNATSRTSFRYDGFGNLIEEAKLLDKNTWGTYTDLGYGKYAYTYHYYDITGRETMRVDPEGYATKYEYSATGQLVTQTEYAQRTEGEGRGTQRGVYYSDKDRTTTYVYDLLGRKTSETSTRYAQDRFGNGAVGTLTNIYTYDNEGQLIRSRINDQIVSMSYDALGRMVGTREAERGAVTAAAAGLIANGDFSGIDDVKLYQTVAPTTTMRYDAFGNLVQQSSGVDGSSLVTQTFRYDWQGRNVWQRDVLGNELTRTFDAADRVLEERRKVSYATFSQSESGKFNYTWKAAPELGDWAWLSTRFSYDSIGRQLGKQSFRESFASDQTLGEVIEASERVEYNAFGEIIVKDMHTAGAEVDQTIRYQYDDHGNVVWTNADGVERRFTYDAGNRQISESHQVRGSNADSWNGWHVQNSLELDLLGRVVSRTRMASGQDGNAADTVIQHSYDRWGNQTWVRDAKGNETSFEYNDANQLISQTAPEVKVVSATGVTTYERPVMRWFYDAMGQLVGTRDANGNGRRYAYDIRGRMTSEEDAAGGIKRYRYDALGRQTLSSDADGTMTLKQVDAAGRVVSVWADNGNKADGSRSWQEMERYVLDQDGNRLVSIDSNGKVTKASYDSQGRMIRSESATGVVMEYAYDLRGNKILERNALARSNRENAAEGWNWRVDREGQHVYFDEKTWEYDAFNRVIDHNDLSGLDYDYIYDLNTGHLLSMSISNKQFGLQRAANASAQMEQDPEFPEDPGEPAPPTPPPVYSERNYFYNADGLVARVEEQSTSRDPATGARRVNTTRYQYDANGNRTLEETTSYDANNQLLHVSTRTSYDAHNRIERVIQDDLVAQRRLLDVRYSYDAVGNRRLVEMGSAFNPAGEQPSNASFEDGNRGWTSGEGWVISQRGAGGAANTGTWGAEFKGSNKGPQSITNNKRVAVSAGQTITASAMIQQGASAAGAANARVLVIWYDAAGNMLLGGDGKSWTGGNLITGGSNGEWGKSQVTTTVPPGAAFMAIGGSAIKGVNANSLWMDDFQWTIGPIPNPAPINAGMEQGSTNWDLGEGWTIGQEGANGDALTGTFSAQFNGSNSGPKSITNQERVPVVPGQSVTASVMAQQGASSAGDASAQVLIVWYDADFNMLPGGLGSSWSAGNVVDSGSNGRWHKSSVTATVPPGAVFMSIGASANKAAGGDPLWVDDFQWTYTPVESGIKELPVDKAYWFEYDKENRVTVSNGMLQAGKIVIANDDTSSLQSYDKDGKVTLRQSYDNGVLKRQQLFYDDQGRVVRIVQTLPDNVTRLLETSRYDASGRLLERRQYADDGSAKRIDVSSYDADGRLISQSAYGIPMGGVYQPVDEDGNPLPLPDDGLEGLQLLSVVNYQDGTLATGYDAAGRLRGYRYSLVRNEQGSGMTTPEGYTHTYRYTYQGAETYLTQQVIGTSTHRDFKTSNSTSTYDAWGKLLSVRENTPGGKVDDRLRYFTMDAEGNILRRTEGTFKNGVFEQDDAERLRTEQYAFANGQYVAAGRFDGKTDVLGQMNAYASTDVGTYKVTVQAGDTLRGLAQRLYGNSNLWYVLAEANAIDDDSGLVAGATLNVPDVKANTNDATTFKPFNASEAIGSTTPSLPYIPKPPESGCGTLGMIIMVVVAIVVTIYTAGAAAGLVSTAAASATAAAGGTIGATMATGAAALAGGFTATAAVVGGAAGAFAGSLASQGVGSAMGQTSFSWRNVAASTVAGAATAGFGTLVSGAPAVVAAVATAAVGNVSSYVANKLVGNEASFSWKSVAASAVAAGITQQLAPTIARNIGVDSTQYGQAITSGITGGIVSAHVRQGIVGGAIDYQDVFVDAFGNAVNGALMQRGQAALAARSQSDRPSLSASIGGAAALSDPDYRASWLYGSGAEAQSAQIDSQRQYELDRQLTDLTGLGAADRRQQIADLVEEVRGGGQQLSQGQAQRFMDLYGVTAFEANDIVLSDPQVNLLSYVGHARLDDAGSFFTSELAVPSLYAGADEVAAWRTDFWAVDQRSQSIQPHPHNELQAGSAFEVTHILSNEEAQQARLEQANDLIARDGRALLYTAVVQPAVAGIGGAVTPLGMSIWGLVQSRDMYQQGNKKMAGVTAALSLLGVKASLRMPGSGVLSQEAAGLIPVLRLQAPGASLNTISPGSHSAQIGAVGVQSPRDRLMGGTPDKYSRVGREVVERMRSEGTIVGDGPLLRGNPNNLQLVVEDGSLVRIDHTIDMAHQMDAVSWWNSYGIRFGAKAPEVRQFMLDSNNYILQPRSINRSEGARIGQTYLDPSSPNFDSIKR